MSIKRREFLAHAAAGSAVLTVPGFLTGCGIQQATALGEPTPQNPFMDWFGMDQAATSRVMSELTARGADAADLYFQHTRSNSLSLEDGIVSNARSSIQQGVGLRVVIGEQTGYAFTEDLTLPSMLAAARTASAIASGSQAVAPQAFAPRDMGQMYTTTVPWSDVGIDQKLPILKFVEQKAKAMEPSIEKVSVYWGDGDERVMIATLDGKLITDHRPMTRLTVPVTVKKGDEVQQGHKHLLRHDRQAGCGTVCHGRRPGLDPASACRSERRRRG
jgi:TldD protein